MVLKKKSISESNEIQLVQVKQLYDIMMIFSIQGTRLQKNILSTLQIG